MDGVDDNMGVDMLPVLVHSDEGLIALQCRRFHYETLCVFQDLFRCNGFPWRERIDEMLVLPTVRLMEQLFRQHHVVIGVLWVAINASHQMLFRLLRLCYVINDTFQRCS